MTYTRSFSNWTEYLGVASLPQIKMCGEHSRKTDVVRGTKEPWHGTKTWEEALEQATNGWKEGVQLIRKLSDPLVADLASAVRKPEILFRDEPGLDYDLGLVLMGEAEHWKYFSPTTEEYMVGQREFTICLNLATASGTSSEAIRKRGAVAAALCYLTEIAGIRTKLVVQYAVRSGNDIFNTEVVIKEHNQELDIDKLAFAVISPASLRRLQFANYETWLEFTKSRDFSCYGYPVDYTPDCKPDLYLKKLEWGTPEAELDSEAFVRKQLVGLGAIEDGK